MQSGGRPEGGVCAAVDVHYLSTGGARRQPSWPPMPPLPTCWPNTPQSCPRSRPNRPGQFYLRELPPLRAVLADLSGLGIPRQLRSSGS